MFVNADGTLYNLNGYREVRIDRDCNDYIYVKAGKYYWTSQTGSSIIAVNITTNRLEMLKNFEGDKAAAEKSMDAIVKGLESGADIICI